MNNTKIPDSWIHKLKMRFSELWEKEQNPITTDNFENWRIILNSWPKEILKIAVENCKSFSHPISGEEFNDLCGAIRFKSKGVGDPQTNDPLYIPMVGQDKSTISSIGGNKSIKNHEPQLKNENLAKLANISETEALHLPMDERYERICHLREIEAMQWIKEIQGKSIQKPMSKMR